MTSTGHVSILKQTKKKKKKINWYVLLILRFSIEKIVFVYKKHENTLKRFEMQRNKSIDYLCNSFNYYLINKCYIFIIIEFLKILINSKEKKINKSINKTI